MLGASGLLLGLIGFVVVGRNASSHQRAVPRFRANALTLDYAASEQGTSHRLSVPLQGVEPRPFDISPVNYGASTSVAIPADSGHVDASGRCGGEPDWEDLSVLVVDDDQLAAESLGASLGALGCQWTRVATWSMALDALQVGKHDLVVADVSMSTWEGFHVFDELNDLDPRSQPSIIALSAEGDANAVERIHSAGFDGYLCKPFTLSQLSEQLRKFVGQDK